MPKKSKQKTTLEKLNAMLAALPQEEVEPESEQEEAAPLPFPQLRDHGFAVVWRRQTYEKSDRKPVEYEICEARYVELCNFGRFAEEWVIGFMDGNRFHKTYVPSEYIVGVFQSREEAERVIANAPTHIASLPGEFAPVYRSVQQAHSSFGEGSPIGGSGFGGTD